MIIDSILILLNIIMFVLFVFFVIKGRENFRDAKTASKAMTSVKNDIDNELIIYSVKMYKNKLQDYLIKEDKQMHLAALTPALNSILFPIMEKSISISKRVEDIQQREFDEGIYKDTLYNPIKNLIH